MMYSTRFAVCLGMLAGSLTIAAVAKADIPITGGQAAGDAAFFVPRTSPGTGATGTNGGPILFDTAIQTLKLVTPNGTTTTSRFIPNASRFTDTNSNNIPDKGDTGRLEGTLSGVAFSANGNPVFFQGVPTALDFTLTSFSPSFIQGGSLISPKQAGTAPLIFLPVNAVTLSSESSASFSAQSGLLNVGPFEAALKGDSIQLPSDLQLRPTSDTSNLPPAVLGRRIKFNFEGTNVRPAGTKTDFDTADGTIAFSGPTTSFKVQSVGTQGTREFNIEGTAANLDLEITGPFSLQQQNVLSSTASTTYQVKGEGPGFVAFGSGNSVAFAGTSRKDTEFKFQQGNARLEGKSSGDVDFTLAPNPTNASNTSTFGTNFTPAVGVNNNGTAFTPSSTSTGSISSTGTGTGSATGSGSTSNSSTTNTSTTSTSVFNTIFIVSSNSTYINRFTLSSVAGRDRSDEEDDKKDDKDITYTVYQPKGSVQVVVERDAADRLIVVERERGRGPKARRQQRVLSVYQIVGLPSRVFPGLVGLKQLPPEQAQSTSTTGTTTTGTTTTTTGTTTTGTSTSGSTTSGTTTPASTTGTTTTPDATTAPAGTTGTTTTPDTTTTPASTTGTTTTPDATTAPAGTTPSGTTTTP